MGRPSYDRLCDWYSISAYSCSWSRAFWTRHQGGVWYANGTILHLAFSHIPHPDHATYVEFLNSCTVLLDTPVAVAAWACVVAFDTIAIILALLNALDRPRHRDIEVMRHLQHDGAPFFIVRVILRRIYL